MKNIAAIALFVAGTFVVAGQAYAQDHALKANVPFNFTVGNRTVPAGTYTISSDMADPDLVAIRNYAKKVGVMSLGQPGESNPRHDNTLVFHKYGNQYFLSEIRSADAAMNIHFATTKAEKRARTLVEEAGLFVNDPVLIALN